MISATIIASVLIVSINKDHLDDFIYLLMPIIVLSVLVPRQIVIAVILIDVIIWLSFAFTRGLQLNSSFSSFLIGSMLTIFEDLLDELVCSDVNVTIPR